MTRLASPRITSFQLGRAWRALFVGIAASVSSVSYAAVELVQLTTANIDNYVTGPARQAVVPGDVVLRNDMISVAILTGSSKNDTTRSGRCIVLTDSDQVASHPLSQVTPGPLVPWTRPEAGSNPNLAVLRFYRTESNWTAELTYRLRDGVPWVEVTTSIVNKNADRVLEIPIVDRVESLASGKGEKAEEGVLTLSATDRPTIGFVAVGNSILAEEAKGSWLVGIKSGDPLEGAFRRASARLLSMGRQSTSYMPLEAGREWTRTLRDRESWHRIEAKKDRLVARRIVVASTPNQLASLIPIARESKPSGAKTPAPEATVAQPNSRPAPLPIQPQVIMPEVTPKPSTTVSKPAPKPTTPTPAKSSITGKRRATPPVTPASVKITPSTPPEVPAKITGKLRDADVKEVVSKPSAIELPVTLLPNDSAPVPSLPSKSIDKGPSKPASKPKAAEVIEDTDLAPTIDAIEELPPPVE
jgi:hypothetical protein